MTKKTSFTIDDDGRSVMNGIARPLTKYLGFKSWYIWIYP